MKRLGLAFAFWAAFSFAAFAQIGGLSFPGPGPRVASGGGSPSYTYPISAGLTMIGGGGATNTFSGLNLGTGSQFVLLAIDITGSANAGITGVTVNGSSLTLIQDDGGHNVTFYAGTATLNGSTDNIVISSIAGAFNFLDIDVAPWVLSNLSSTTKISSTGSAGTTSTAGPTAASTNNFIFMAHNGGTGTYTVPAGITNRTFIVGGGSSTTLIVGDVQATAGMISAGNFTATTSANMFGNIIAVWD